MINKIITEHRVGETDGSLALNVRLTLKLRAESRGDSERLIAALSMMKETDCKAGVILELMRQAIASPPES